MAGPTFEFRRALPKLWGPRSCGFCKGRHDAAYGLRLSRVDGPTLTSPSRARGIGPWFPPLQTAQGWGTLSRGELNKRKIKVKGWATRQYVQLLVEVHGPTEHTRLL